MSFSGTKNLEIMFLHWRRVVQKYTIQEIIKGNKNHLNKSVCVRGNSVPCRGLTDENCAELSASLQETSCCFYHMSSSEDNYGRETH